MNTNLEQELKKYDSLLPELLKDEGKFAVIFGDELLGIYANYEDALKIGYEKAKLEPFLVKKISSIEVAHYFSRNIEASCHIAHA